MSDLSELDDATIDIETAVRRELPEPQKNLKSTVEKSRPKTKRMKRKETAKVTTKKSDTESEVKDLKMKLTKNLMMKVQHLKERDHQTI